MTASSGAVAPPDLTAFLAANPEFDLLRAELLHAPALDALAWDGCDGDREALLTSLRRWQRVLRIEPDPERALRLLALGFDSAHRITELARGEFVRRVGLELEGGAADAGVLYDTAAAIRSRANHLAANVHALVGSAHFRAANVNHVAASLTDYFENLVSYAALFGTLDYCECAECASVLGPAAYLVDLLRIVDKAITVPNAATIPPGLTFDARRPDIAALPLTCANTDDTVPYLAIVDAALEQAVATQLGVIGADAVYRALATRLNPPGLPFHLPLTRIRHYLGTRGQTLGGVYAQFAGDTGTIPPEQARELLGLTAESMAALAPAPDAAHLQAAVDAAYGLPVTAADLQGLDRLDGFVARTGLQIPDVQALLTQGLGTQELLDTTGSYSVTGAKGTPLVLVQDGATVAGTYPGGTVTAQLDGLQLRGIWRESATGAEGGLALTFAASGATFAGTFTVGPSGAAAGGAWAGTLSGPATGGVLAHSLFINHVLPAGGYLRLAENATDPHDVFTEIAGQSIATLDTLDRFGRLARALGWSWADLDWTLTTLCPPTVDGGGNVTSAAELGGPTLQRLAGVVRLLEDHSVPLALATALWFDLKTTGRGDGAASQAPFDLLFNAAAVLARSTGRSVYRPAIALATGSLPNPLYRDTPLDWTVGTSTAAGASAGGLVVGSLPAGPDALQRVAAALFGAGATIQLTVPNLSALSRHTAFAQQLQLAASDYIALAGLLGIAKRQGTLPATLTPDDALKLARATDWLAASGLRVVDVAYAVGGPADPSVTTGYDPATVPAFLAALAQVLAPALVTAATFASPLVAAPAAAAILQTLVAHGVVDPFGVVIGDPAVTPPDLSGVAVVAPAVGALSDAQAADAIARLAAARAQQEARLAGQLGPLFGLAPDLAGALATGATRWRRLADPVAAFASAPLFSVAVAGVVADRALDPALVEAAFATNKTPLGGTPAIAPLSPATWAITAQAGVASVTFTAVADDDAVTFFAAPATTGAPAPALFDAAAASVLADGELDAKLVTAAFAAQRVPLTLTRVAIVDGLVPSAWTVTDPVSGLVHGATAAGADIVFSVPTAAAPVAPAPVADVLALISRGAVLATALGLTTAATAALFAAPAAFGIADDGTRPLGLTLDGIEGAAAYARLRTAFGDTGDGLATFLAGAAHDPDALVLVTGWDPTATAHLCTELFGAATGATTVARVGRLARLFRTAAALGVDVYALDALHAARAMPASGTAWTAAGALADGLLQARAAATPPDRRPAALAALDAPLLEARRDALVAFAIEQLGQEYADITTPRALYEYLLLDVQMAGCAQISPIREALNATQLYLQRCRLNLEQGAAIDPDDLPGAWWEWLLDYRVWEANRQVFLNPENYIDPSLRSTRTQLFQDLQDDLAQGPLTDDAIGAAFHKYLDALSEVARLVPVDSCRAIVHDAEQGPVDTLFVFSRTVTQPYTYYMATRQTVADCESGSGETWSEWQPIDITINAPYVTPVFVFNRLYVLWVEVKTKKDADGSTDPTGRYTITQASIKLTYRSLSGAWMQPQTILADQVVDADASDIHGVFAEVYADSDALWWNKVAAVCVPCPDDGSNHGSGDKLCVYYGPLADPAELAGAPLTEPHANPDALDFYATIVQTTYATSQSVALGGYARLPINPALVLDAGLSPTSLTFDGEYVLVTPNPRSATSPPTFRPVLGGSALAIQPDRQTVLAEYVAGTTLVGDAVAGADAVVDWTWFASDLVDDTAAQAYLAALSAPPTSLIDANGHVSPGAATISSAIILSIVAGVPGATIEIAREVREALLTGLYGTPALLAAAGTQGTALTPTHNQPGAFLFTTGSQTFLIEGATANAAFPRTDAALAVTQPFAALTPLSFVSRDVSAVQSANFHAILTTQNYLDPHGVVNVTMVKGLTLALLRSVLAEPPVGQAQQVLATLIAGAGPAALGYTAGGFLQDDTVHTLAFSTTRLSTSAVDPLERALYAGGVDALLALPCQQLPINPTLPFAALGPTAATLPNATTPRLAPPASPYAEQVDFSGVFGVYFWELFFHAPFLIANMLRDDQQFQAAQRWYQYVFDPTRPPEPLTAAGLAKPGVLPDGLTAAQAPALFTALTPTFLDAGGTVTLAGAAATAAGVQAVAPQLTPAQAEGVANLLRNRYLAKPSTGVAWRFAPLRNATLEALRDQLSNCAEIAAYDDDPFDPHAIARLRIGAYEKAIVMAYVQNLIAWGDQEFSQYTWESVTTARMLYSYAYDLLGPRPEDLGACRTQPPVTFGEIRARYAADAGGIPQFLIDMENALGGGQAAGPMLAGAGRAFNDLGTLFAVPENDQLIGLWDTVEDRLHKIRNCMDIEGQRVPLALWDPPLDPMDLVRAAAGGDFAGLASQLQPAVPNYRFAVMIERAEELTETVRSFGSALLTALERRDAEALALVRAAQEVGVLNMVTVTKQAAIDDLQDQLAGLRQALASASYRVSYYAGLIAAGLNAAEISNLTLTAAAIVARGVAIPFQGLSIPGHLAPDIYGFADGGMKFGDAINVGATIASTVSDMLGTSATLAQTVGANQRRAEEWQLARQTAEYEVAELTQQIAATQRRVDGAIQDLAINAQEIANAARVETLMRTNFTNQDLYTWMTGRVATVYFQAFRLAQDLALSAQTAYRFELNRDEDFVAFGNWDSLHQGLLAGEGLLLSLKQMKKAYMDNNVRTLEIEKTISLRQAFPQAFAGFRWGNAGGAPAAPGRLDFTLSEALFDFDFPGHYDRKIKSVSVSLPSVVGPYQDFHLTLTQNTNMLVLVPDAAAVDYAIARTTAYPPGTPPPDPPGAVRENWAPSQSIAVSRGVDDSGLFTLDFRDERYLPFEGTGAVSSWSLSLPPDTNRIAFDNISDVILKVRYTARDGGSAFASKVKRLYAQDGDRYAYLAAGVYNLASAFAAQWGALVAPPVSGTRTITFPVPLSVVTPNLGATRLHGVVVQLELEDGATVTSPDGAPFLTLQVDGKPTPTPLAIPITDNHGELKPADVAGAGIGTGFAGVPWTLAFTTGGAFDLAQLKDVLIAVVYSAHPFAP